MNMETLEWGRGLLPSDTKERWSGSYPRWMSGPNTVNEIQKTVMLVTLLSSLTGLSGSDTLTGTLVPPPADAENAAKALRKLCESATSSDASAEQAEMDIGAVTALLQEATEGSPASASVLCAAVIAATTAIDAIDKHPEVDAAEAGLLRWGHLRVNVLQVLLHLASSELGCTRVLAQTSDGAASACIALLRSNASRTDMEGVRTAANILKNLSMPPAIRARVGSLEGLYDALLNHVTHRDPNTGAIAAATLRILVEGCAPNARLAALTAAGAETGAVSRATSAGASDEEAERTRLSADSSESGFGPVLAADLTKMHPFCRVELARFMCLALSQALDNLAPWQQRRLTTAAVLRFAIFPLASKHAPLHREVCAALLAARRVYRERSELGPWPVSTLVCTLWVPGPQGERSLAAELQQAASAGTISVDELAVLVGD